MEKAGARVIDMQGVEGYVVQTQGEHTLKLKTWWWHDRKMHKYQRWHSDDQRQFEEDKRQHKLELMQVQGCRAVVQGWPADLSPARILDKVITAVKAEEFITRSTGKRKAIVLSFRTPQEKNI